MTDAAGAERLVVALVRGVHGLRGTVRVEVLSDRPDERYAPGSVLHREGSDEPLTVASSAPVADGPGWRIRFEEVTTRTAAERLMGAYLEWVAGPQPALARGEYFWHEVIGATVTNVDGAALGTVRDVYRSGGAEVYVVGGGPYGEFDVPGVRDFIRIFAPRRGEIVVDADALDLRPPRRPSPGERPKAPRRRSGPRRRGAPGASSLAPPGASSLAPPAAPPPGASKEAPPDSAATDPPGAASRDPGPRR